MTIAGLDYIAAFIDRAYTITVVKGDRSPTVAIIAARAASIADFSDCNYLTRVLLDVSIKS